MYPKIYYEHTGNVVKSITNILEKYTRRLYSFTVIIPVCRVSFFCAPITSSV